MIWKCLSIFPRATVTLVSGLVFYGKENIFDPKKPTCVQWDNDWDRREPQYYLDAKSNIDSKYPDQRPYPTATRHLFLVRHGQYNVYGKTDRDQHLTPLGRQQALLSGKRLKEYGFQYTMLLSSRMTRAIETAEIIQKELQIDNYNRSDLFTEGAPVCPEPPVQGWDPNKDPFHEDGIRIEAGFRRLCHRADPSQTSDSHEIIVCHANVIRYFVCRALQLPPEAWLRMSLNHGSITWLTIYPTGDVVLQQLGDTGFMPINTCTTYNFPENVFD